MDILDSLFNSGKNTLISIFNIILNSLCTLSIINKKIERCANIDEELARIRIFGIGGAGGKGLQHMINSGLGGSEQEAISFIYVDTDAQALACSGVGHKILLGKELLHGCGAGARPEIGADAAEESLDVIREAIGGADMVFVTAGMGGGTGTGAASIIAKAAKEKGVLTVGVVTKPFHFEGHKRMRSAMKGIDELRQHVDSLVTISNERLLTNALKNVKIVEIVKKADDGLYAAVRDVIDLITKSGMINADFTDVRTVMSKQGMAFIGEGVASGEKRAIVAATKAIQSQGQSAGHIYSSDYGRKNRMDTKENKNDFNIQAIIGDMLHEPGFLFNREQFLRAEFHRFYPQDIIDKIVISNPANVGVPPEVIEEILKPLFWGNTFKGYLSMFNYKFEYIYQTCYKHKTEILGEEFWFDSPFDCGIFIHSFFPIFYEDDMLRFCRELLCILQVLIYLYGLQQININNNDTSYNSEILNFFIIGMGAAMLEDAEAKEEFMSIIALLRKNNTHQQIIKGLMIDRNSHILSRKIAARLKKILKKNYISHYTPYDMSSPFFCKNIADCLKLELYYPQYIQTLRENRCLI